MSAALLLVVLLLAFVLVANVCRTAAAKSNNLVANWITTVDINTGGAIDLLVKSKDIVATSSSGGASSGNGEINDADFSILVNSSSKFQTISGFGAGLPQSSAFTLISLKRRSAELYANVMNALFASGSDGGAGLNILRFSMGSCDFSMHNTSFDEVSGDFSLSHFAIDPDSEYIIEVINDALKINPDITIIASPWSAPSWLKAMNSLIGISSKNTLIDKEEVYITYADYFMKTISAYRQRGIDIHYLTLQNEPLFGDNHEYPGMYLSSEDAYRLGAKLFEKMSEVMIANPDTKKTYILGYDHNWDNFSYPLDLLNIQEIDHSGKQRVFTGTAWHCYDGTMSEAMDVLFDAYPSFEQHITECTGSFPESICDISRGMEGFGFNHEWDMKNLFLGALGHNAKSGTKWILALDENCGPVLPDVSFRNGRPFVSIPSNASDAQDIKYNQDYWTTSHMSRFFSAGSVRIGRSILALNQSSSSTTSINDIMMECTVKAALTTCMAMNLNHQTSFALHIEDESISFQYKIPPFSTSVFQWHNTAN